MFQLGIFHFPTEKGQNPLNLFNFKSPIFAYLHNLLFRKNLSLFPKYSEVFNFANTKCGPKFCAVDDLDPFDTYNVQELIEFQSFKQGDNVINSSLGVFGMEDNLVSRQASHAASMVRFANGGGYDDDYAIPTQTSQTHQHQHQNQYPHPHQNQNQNHHQHQHHQHQHQNEHQNQHQHQHQQQRHLHNNNSFSEPIQMPQLQSNPSNEAAFFFQTESTMSHFNLNMSQSGPDLIGDRYFDDFVRTSTDQADYQSIYGSSSDSYVSPLDDDFFKKFSPQTNICSEDALFKSREHSLVYQNGFEVNDQEHFTDQQVQAQSSQSEPISRKRKLDTPSPTSTKSSVSYYSADHADYMMSMSQGPRNTSEVVSVKQEQRDQPIPNVEKVEKHASQKDNNSGESNKKVKTETTSDDYKFQCTFCDATFKVKGYLTRHLKKHNSSMAFVCPFYQEIPNTVCSTSKKNVFSGTKCHPTGGFSRRDTFKTHLKALHFIYPPGTKQVERNCIGGRCAGCFKYFENNHRWLVEHIEKQLCEGSVSRN